MSAGKFIPPIDLRDFLKAAGWNILKEGLDHRQYVLDNPQHPRRQLIYPMDTTAPDYIEAVERVIEKLADITKRSAQSIYSALSNLHEDVLKLRVFFDGDDRSLPLPFASTLVANTEKLLKAGACTVLQPRISHPKLSLAEAVQFIDHSRFGQTEEGSFILSVSCPINALDAQGKLQFDEQDAPFVRQVTISLQSAMTQLVQAIEADTLTSLVDELRVSPSPIISANLCDALAGMHDEHINNALDIGFVWSPKRASPSRGNAGPIRLQRDYFSRIEEVRRALKAHEEDEDDSFIGTVEKMEGVMGADGRRTGPVMLALLLPDGEIVRARVDLDAEDYLKANAAHLSHGSYVRLKGRLRQGRQPRQLLNIETFEWLSPGEPIPPPR
ncbi:hypothetical protein GFM09_21615 [Rhizobium leguminosarum bv. viciae]|jgi:hypothetical protein|uniref:hypothetical protein n=1 Tax=Rhizobium leguminosarum TaxID=384 RepID=UPI0014423F32|nr:hypothetical protein [Rhizobium leguminosarum]NKL63909.1 hypothetical protein [Rhizobium leguminosarum bv. viciae]NKL71841.1 hypothetical protein [Rhizobium leguminosarum bv. viciae]NKL83815.1 hypothetical protein [Rhizobium leguminosarum bv. viciae]